MNVLVIAGNVGKNAELRHTPNGDAVLGFSLAVDNGKDKTGNKRDPTWFECSIWGKRATALETYIVKGTKLALSGRVSARSHNDKAYLGLSVSDLTFMGANANPGQSSGQQSSGFDTNNNTGVRSDSDDIPFN